MGHNGALTEFSLLACVCMSVCACIFVEASLCAQACEVCVHMPQMPMQESGDP